MSWMEDTATVRRDTAALVPDARSLVTVAAPYGPIDGSVSWGSLWARYAVSDDYHVVVAERLRALGAFVAAEAGTDVRSTPAVDGAPILERSLAVETGVGWLGKSAMVLDQELGSYFFLAQLVVSADLTPSADLHPDRCGAFTRCLDACPTGAIVEPYRVDARRCIAYLTIELRGPIPRSLRPAIGTHLFGCDVCQEVCPWNTSGQASTLPGLAPRPEVVALEADRVLRVDAATFSRMFRDSPIKRAKRVGLARNAAVVLGNTGDRVWVGTLVGALRTDPAPLVRGHAAWALGALGGRAARAALGMATAAESDEYVREEIRFALSEEL